MPDAPSSRLRAPADARVGRTLSAHAARAVSMHEGRSPLDMEYELSSCAQEVRISRPSDDAPPPSKDPSLRSHRTHRTVVTFRHISSLFVFLRHFSSPHNNALVF